MAFHNGRIPVNGIATPDRRCTLGDGGRGADEIVGGHSLNLSVPPSGVVGAGGGQRHTSQPFGVGMICYNSCQFRQ
jgi:hypothetical protein